MAQRFLDLQTQTPGLSPRREEHYFPQGQADGGERALCPFPPHPLPGEERRGPGQHADSGAWSADNSLLSNTMDCWPEPYLKASSRESVVAEADQTEDGTTASCSQHEDEAHTLVSEADSWNGLRWLGARAESWADTAKENAPNTVPPASKRPKGRTTFSGEQLRVLQQRFHLQRYVSASERQELGHALGMSSQQVKTWFQNRRMKVKRIVKEPADSPVVSYLRPDSTQGNPLAFRNLTEYMQHQFHPLPKHMVTSSAQAWPCPESMCPALGSLQSTVIKSALHYTNRSVKFSIALSSQPDTEQGPQSVSSSSPSSPEQQFLMPHAFPQHGALQSGHLHAGASGAGLHHGAPQPGLHHGAGLHHGGPQPGHLHPRVSGNGLQHRAPGTGLHHGAGLQHRAPGTGLHHGAGLQHRAPGAGLHYGAGLHHEAPQFGYLHHGASGNGLHPGATGTGHLHPGALHQGLPQPEAQSCVLMRYQAAESGGLREGRGFS